MVEIEHNRNIGYRMWNLKNKIKYKNMLQYTQKKKFHRCLCAVEAPEQTSPVQQKKCINSDLHRRPVSVWKPV